MIKILLLLLTCLTASAGVAPVLMNSYTTNTQAAADLHVAALETHRFPAARFGITQSYQGRNGANCTAGSSNVTCSSASFTTNDIGKYMMMTGGRSDGYDWVGVITNIVSPTVVSLNTVCTCSTNGLPVQWGFDDTAALNAGLAYCTTNGGGIIMLTNCCVVAGALFQPTNGFPDVTYASGRGFANDLTNKNAQLYLPDLPVLSRNCPVIGFEGTPSPIVQLSAARGDTTFLFGGAGLVSFLSASNNGAAMFNGINCWSSTFYFNPVKFYAKNMLFRCPPNGTTTALQLRYVDSVDLDTVYVDRGWQLYSAPLPMGSVSNSFGIVFPPGLNSGWQRIHKSGVCGFYNGISLGEHIVGTGGLEIWSCWNAVSIDIGGHVNVFDRLDCEDVKNYFANRPAAQPYNQIIANLTTENIFADVWSYGGMIFTNCSDAFGGTIILESPMTGLTLGYSGQMDVRQFNASAVQKFRTLTPQYGKSLIYSNATLNAALGTVALLLSTDNSYACAELRNTYRNEIRFNGDNLANDGIWDIGTPGATGSMANGSAYGAFDFLVWRRFGQGALAAFHQASADFEMCSNAVSHGYVLKGTNTFTAPAGLTGMGAHLWSDGTNLCIVFQTAGGTRTTNKVSFTSWP